MSGLARRRALVAGAAMAVAAAAARWATPTVHAADLAPKVDLQAWFPRAFGGWRIDTTLAVVIPSPDAQALLNRLYNQTLSRTYVDAADQRVMLSVAYGGDQSDGTRAHRPEVCYPAQGFSLTDNRVGELTIGERRLRVRQLMAHLGGRHEPITYWTVVGQQVALSGTEQKLAQMRYGLRGLIPDGLLVRMSSIDADKVRGWALQTQFLQALDAALPADVRRRILGGPALD
jgi:EpsI family protein